MNEKKLGAGNGCPVYKKCSACQLQNMEYEEQLHFKQAKLVNLLGRYCHIDEIIGMENPMRYRCKVQSSFGFIRGKIISGVYQSATGHIIDINNNCMLEDEIADEIIRTIKRLCRQFNIKAYDRVTCRGNIRSVLVRVGKFTGQYMVVITTADRELPSKRAFVAELLKYHPVITTVVHNINSKVPEYIMSESQEILYGDGYIEDFLCGKRFRISPSSFYQINPIQAEIVYCKAFEFINLKGDETLLDAYCGTGTIGIIAANHAARVIGTELNPSAIRDAEYNAALNNVKNIKFICADASKFMDSMTTNNTKIDVAVIDPPRAGCDTKFIKSLTALGSKKIVYISCNPETLARDLYVFIKDGYKVKKIAPVDMFPHTGHVETVCLLTHKI